MEPERKDDKRGQSATAAGRAVKAVRVGAAGGTAAVKAAVSS